MRLATLTLAFIACYRLADFTMGVMTNPFYLDIGFTLKEIAAIAKGFGVVWSILGTLLGGVVVARFGLVRSLALGSVLVILANLLFALFAWFNEPTLFGLAALISADNLAMGIAGTALIAYLSSLTSATYTATQYALFSSMYALPGKLLMGTSGIVVDAIGYPKFFVYTLRSASQRCYCCISSCARPSAKSEPRPARSAAAGWSTLSKPVTARRPEIDLARVICPLHELADPGASAFTMGEGDWPLRGFVVRQGDSVHAYVNHCPHAGFPLNWSPEPVPRARRAADPVRDARRIIRNRDGRMYLRAVRRPEPAAAGDTGAPRLRAAR